MNFGRRWIVLVCLGLLVAAFPAAAAQKSRSGQAGRRHAPADPRLVDVLQRFDRVQAGIQTISADFTWTTESALLKDPMVCRGTFYMTKPKAVRWEFKTPEPMEFVIAHDEYVGYFPKRKKAEKRNFKRWSDRVFRYFGLGQASSELSKVYRIRLGDAGDLAGKADLLILEPKKRRARKKIRDLKIWVGKDSSLPMRVVTTDPAGGKRVIEFRNTAVNPTFASNLYEVHLPSDVVVTEGFSGLGGAGPRNGS